MRGPDQARILPHGAAQLIDGNAPRHEKQLALLRPAAARADHGLASEHVRTVGNAGAQRVEPTGERRRLAEIGQKADAVDLLGGRDLNAGDKADAGFFRFGSHGGTVARGIVIRDGDQLQPRFLGGFNDRRRRHGIVRTRGETGVNVKVCKDHFVTT